VRAENRKRIMTSGEIDSEESAEGNRKNGKIGAGKMGWGSGVG
jgi:hypothetical protein